MWDLLLYLVATQSQETAGWFSNELRLLLFKCELLLSTNKGTLVKAQGDQGVPISLGGYVL